MGECFRRSIKDSSFSLSSTFFRFIPPQSRWHYIYISLYMIRKRPFRAFYLGENDSIFEYFCKRKTKVNKSLQLLLA